MCHRNAALALAVVFVAGEGCVGVAAEEAVFVFETLAAVEERKAEVDDIGVRRVGVRERVLAV